MAEGHLLQKSGKKNKLWSSIQVYNKAATTLEKAGAPHYYIGKSYHKLGDKDFDLIIESYDKALALELSTELRKLASQDREDVLMREKVKSELFPIVRNIGCLTPVPSSSELRKLGAKRPEA